MALTNCKECKKEVSTEAKTCPHCGINNPGVIDNNRRAGIALVLFIFLCIYLFTRPESEQPEPMEAPTAQENVSPAVTPPVNQEQPKQEALYQELKQEIEQDKTKNSLSTDTPQKMVMRMLEYALDDGGLSHESEIQQTKLQIESLPKPAKGNKKAARVFNADGLASSKNYDFNNAVKMFQEANKLDKSDIEIASNLGFSYLKQGDLDLAQHAIIIALSMSPDRSSAWADLGAVFGLKGDVSKAVACFSNTYRFSKDRLKTHQFMKKLNETEDVVTLKQARTEAISWAEKSYPNIPQDTESKEKVIMSSDITQPATEQQLSTRIIQFRVGEFPNDQPLQFRNSNGVAFLPNDNIPFTGKVEGFYQNGQKYEFRYYRNGQVIGFDTKWYENGQKKEECHHREINANEKAYKSGAPLIVQGMDGPCNTWYENGQKSTEGDWKDLKLDGLQSSWYENGQKMYEGYFKDGKEIGKSSMWDKNGKLQD